MLTPFLETKLRLFFDILDYNKNGYIEADDFQAIGDNLCDILGLDEDHTTAKLIYKACGKAWDDLHQYVDSNRDGRATIQEWLKFANEKMVNCDKSLYNRYVERVIHHLFSFFDHNGDSRISLSEYLDLFMALRLDVKYSAKAFVRLDLDGDEMISEEELHQAVEQFFRSSNEADKGNWLFGSWQKLAI